MAEIMYWEAIRRAHDEEMERDPLVICMGEDIGVAGGTYKATQGLYEKYGADRVMDTPISENGYTGLGVGASFLGVRPIIEIMSVNFAWLAMDQLFNSAAKVRYMSGGQLTAPVVWVHSIQLAWRRFSWVLPVCVWLRHPARSRPMAC